MKDVSRAALEGIVGAMVIGLSAAILFADGGRFGINISLGVGIAVVTMILLLRRWQPGYLTNDMIALCTSAFFFSGMFALRNSVQLLAYNFLALLLIFGLFSLPALRRSFRSSGVAAYAGALISSVFWSSFGALYLVFGDINWAGINKTGMAGRLTPVIKGLVIAAPVLLISGALLVSADARFESLIFQSFDLNVASLVPRVFIFGFVSFIALGLYRSVFFGMEVGKNVRLNSIHGGFDRVDDENLVSTATYGSSQVSFDPKKASYLRLGMTEVCIVLGLMTLMFSTFVFLQLPYLFGGMDMVQSTPGIKLADYARRGVGELTLLAGFVITVLLGMHWLLKAEIKGVVTLFRVMALVQVGLLFVILLSAVQRILLLTGILGYGMSETRFYGMIAVIWVGLILLWFAITVLNKRRLQFAYGTVWITLFLLGIVNLVNPDAFIASRNIELMKQGRAFDAKYNANLSDDAAPVLLESLEHMSPGDRNTVKSILIRNRYYDFVYDHDRDLYYSRDLRGWNYAQRQRYKLVVQKFGEEAKVETR